MNIKKRADKRYKDLQKFHAKFQVPSLNYMLYTKFENHRMLIYLMFHLIDICFLIFWLWSLYYVGNILGICLNQQYSMIEYFNSSNFTTDLNITEFIDNLTMGV